MKQEIVFKKQKQTRIDSQYGNCWQTCWACIFGMSVRKLPEFMREGTNGGKWYERTWEWLDKRGYELQNHTWKARAQWLDENKFYVMQGKSPRGNYDHCVVYKGDKPFWDVHPDDTFLDGEPKYVYEAVKKSNP